MKRIIIQSLVWGTLLALVCSARPREQVLYRITWDMRPEVVFIYNWHRNPAQGYDCARLDLNHDGVVNVQDLQLAANRHNITLYNDIKAAILARACEVR